MMRHTLVLPLVFLGTLVLWTGCGKSPESPRGESSPPSPETAAEGSRGLGPGGTSRTSREGEETAPASDSSTKDGEGPTPEREWRDADGELLAVGAFVALQDGNVCLEAADGSGCVVPLMDLCEADRQRARQASGGLDLAAVGAESTDEVSASDAEAAVDVSPPNSQADNPYRPKVVVPLDFVSKFDNGRYGQMVADGIWRKLDGDGGVVIPDAMATVRGICEAHGLEVGLETPLDEVGRIVREYFDADVAIWGRVERVPPHEWDIYDLSIRCVDFSQTPPKVLYEVTDARTETVSEIPHLYVKRMLDVLLDRPADGSTPVSALAEENWNNNPNLVEGGDFQRARNGVPVGWESTGGQMREPLGNLVRWVPDTSDPTGQNRVIRFTFDESVGNGYGVMYYSQPFAVEEGAKYRFQCRYRTNGPKVKVFIKCYDVTESRFQTDGDDENSATVALKAAGAGGYSLSDDATFYECYRSQQELKGPKNQWNTHTEDFTPRHTKYQPRFGRVDLYAYLGAGVVEFDDVVLKQIVPPSPSESTKTKRHSLDSRVTLEQMRENEQRARQEAADDSAADAEDEQ